MAFSTPQTVVASAARTTSSNSGTLGLADTGGNLNLLVNVSAVSGTSPSLTLTVTWSHDGTTFAAIDGTAESFAAITTAKAVVKQFPIKAPYYQIAWTVAGTTPSLTFSVSEYVTP